MITSIYTTMQSRGLTVSQRHFSTVWCGRAANYMADQGGDTMSDETALELVRRLMKAGHRDLAQRTLAMLLRTPAACESNHRRDLAGQ